MVESFFSNQYKGRTDLFEGLSIWKEEKYQKLQGTYPAIFLSFADIKSITFKNARMTIIRKLVKLYSSFWFLRNYEELNEKDITYFDSITETMSDGAATISINYLADFLNCYHNKKVIILLDEYDTPLQEAYINGYWDDMVSFIRSLFNSTFKTNILHYNPLVPSTLVNILLKNRSQNVFIMVLF